MPTITLQFDLPEEEEVALKSVRGPDAFEALRDLDLWLRNEIKYRDRVELQPAREALHRIALDNDLDLDMF